MNSYFVFTIWIATIIVGMLWLCDYSTKPGRTLAKVDTWPAESRITRHGDLTLVVFMHPKCPCSRATMRQLEEILNTIKQGKHDVEVHILFYSPSEFSSHWIKTDLWRHANRLGKVQADRDGEEAKSFGAIISGHVLLFDKEDRTFAGGVTSGRGHDGESPGKFALIQLIQGKPRSRSANAPPEFPVYGCELYPTGERP